MYGKMDNLDLAIQLASLGWYVFPQGQNKHPFIRRAHQEGDPLYGICHGECGRLGHAHHDAVTGFDAVYDLWKNSGAPASSVVGVNPQKSGLLVMDMDHHEGGLDGFKALKYFLDANEQTVIECGPIQTTPGGGEHYVFKMPSMPADWVMPGRLTIRDENGKEQPCGIDLKYNGAFSTGVLLDGRAYRRKAGHGFDSALTFPPVWILREIAKRNAPVERVERPVNYSQDTDALKAKKALARLSPGRLGNYDDWVKVGMALSCLGAAGLELWHDWSKAAKDYNPKEIEYKFRTFRRTTGNKIHLGSLFTWADQDNGKGA